MAIKDTLSREKIIIITAVIIIGGALLYNLAIEPLVSGWVKTQKEISSKETGLIKNIILLKRYEGLGDKYRDEPLFSSGTGKSEEEEIAQALSEIENISKKSSCPILNIMPREPNKKGNYEEISFEVMTEGGIDGILGFLYEIETSKMAFGVNRFIITSKTGPSGGVKATILISKLLILT